MGIHNSLGPMEHAFYLDLFLLVHNDVASASVTTSVDINYDERTIRSRFGYEGLSFLTKTLPRLGKAVDMALSQGKPLQCDGFAKIRGTQLPKFLGWLFRGIFNADGTERSDASEPHLIAKQVVALRHLRQLCFLFYKLELPYTADQELEVITTFRKTDEQTYTGLYHCGIEVINKARYLIEEVLGPEPDLHGLKPCHGPGAVATGEKPHEKIFFRRYYRALDEVFPYEKYFFYNANHFSDSLDQFLSWTPEESGTAKVVLVPKDSRGPRLISCEPLEYQWIQQGLMSLLTKKISSHPLTRRRVEFRDQHVNRDMALFASKDGSWVTLDMKEASDRVMLELVEVLFPHMWYKALRACRTTATKLPDGTVFPLRKFAPMGSAVCFPVEALVFWALTAATIENSNADQYNLEKVARSVFVFGDDLIVRQKDHLSVLHGLPQFGLLFNEKKCCIAGLFRESCGCDAYRGTDITPLKIKSMWDSRLVGVSHVSWCEYHNSLMDRGYFGAASFLENNIQKARTTPYFDVQSRTSGRTVIDFKNRSPYPALANIRGNTTQLNSDLGLKKRFNADLQAWEIYCWVVRPVRYRTGSPGWEEMLRVASHTHRLVDLESRDDQLLAPVVEESRFASTSPHMVTACQYTAQRRVTQKRCWARVIP